MKRIIIEICLGDIMPQPTRTYPKERSKKAERPYERLPSYKEKQSIIRAN